MNAKRVSWVFLLIVGLSLGCSVLLAYGLLPEGLQSMAPGSVLSEMLIAIPALLLMAVTGTNPIKFCGMNRIRISTLLKTILFSVLCFPLVTFVNALSMLFVDNAVLEYSEEVVALPFVVAFLVISVLPPLCEEFVFRGAIFGGMRESGNTFLAMLFSALFFGLMHMNFNQMSYAFVIGLMLALLAQATGSIWYGILMHAMINSESLIALYVTNSSEGGLTEYLAESATLIADKSNMLLAVSFYFLAALIVTPIAGCVLVWIARGEGRVDMLSNTWYNKGNNWKQYVTIPTVLVSVVCIVVMILTL